MHLIFDFDGTLVDSFEAVLDIFNQLADKFHYRKVDRTEISTLKNLSSREFIQHLNIPLYQIPRVLTAARKKIQKEMLLLSSFTHLPAVLHTLAERRHTLGILTSNSKDNVSTWLAHHNLNHLFEFIHHKSSFFGKKTILKKIIRSMNIDKNKVAYVGDETRDVEAAKLNNIQSIAVTWGFNSEKALEKYQPDHIARQPQDILDICKLFPE